MYCTDKSPQVCSAGQPVNTESGAVCAAVCPSRSNAANVECTLYSDLKEIHTRVINCESGYEVVNQVNDDSIDRAIVKCGTDDPECLPEHLVQDDGGLINEDNVYMDFKKCSPCRQGYYLINDDVCKNVNGQTNSTNKGCKWEGGVGQSCGAMDKIS